MGMTDTWHRTDEINSNNSLYTHRLRAKDTTQSHERVTLKHSEQTGVVRGRLYSVEIVSFSMVTTGGCFWLVWSMWAGREYHFYSRDKEELSMIPLILKVVWLGWPISVEAEWGKEHANGPSKALPLLSDVKAGHNTGPWFEVFHHH